MCMSQCRASDALPITQAPGVGGDSPGLYASLPVDNSADVEDSPAEKGQPQEAQTPKLNTETSPDLVVKGKNRKASSYKMSTAIGWSQSRNGQFRFCFLFAYVSAERMSVTCAGAGADSSAKPQTMLGTISRVVMKPFGFGGFANGESLLHCRACVTAWASL